MANAKKRFTYMLTHLAARKAQLLYAAAEKTVKLGIFAPGNSAVITAVLEVLETFLLTIQSIEQNIKALIIQDTHLQRNLVLLQSFPGIGSHSTIVTLAEIAPAETYDVLGGWSLNVLAQIRP